ncbi:MAG: hypothetical protein JO324_09145 [Candidatus Eremiobacteraeota bacterium]|nr:hypothetical protein [Candidatus Eremiobacteraeota bacterium]
MIIVQENRSFNNLFMGYPGATTSTYGYDTNNKKIILQPVPLEAPYGLEHDAAGFFTACNGTGSIPGTNCQMNGFNRETVTCGSSCPVMHPQYVYVPLSETKPYWDLAKQYVLADQMYASDLDAASFVSHQFIIAAQAESTVNTPYTQWGCKGGPTDTIAKIGPDRQFPYGKRIPACFNDNSIGQEADNAGVSWAFYASRIGGSGGIWSAYQANQYVYYGPDWNNDVITPQTQFFSDVQNGKLRQISWVTPTAVNSDHPDFNSKTGPSWVASLVNAIGQSKYWDSTAIFILWDEYGGFFDPEPPAYVDYDGLGMRIPMLIVSAYAKKGYVSHVQYEHGSVLRFVEDVFGLGRLAASDTRANSPADDSFDFNQPPRKFRMIRAMLGRSYFMHQTPDLRPPDDD